MDHASAISIVTILAEEPFPLVRHLTFERSSAFELWPELIGTNFPALSTLEVIEGGGTKLFVKEAITAVGASAPPTLQTLILKDYYQYQGPQDDEGEAQELLRVIKLPKLEGLRRIEINTISKDDLTTGEVGLALLDECEKRSISLLCGSEYIASPSTSVRRRADSMASLPTLSTRVHAPFLVATCAYCNAKVECVDNGAFGLSPLGEPVRRKLKCAACGKRFLVSKGADGQVHASTPLTIHLPSEILAIIFVHLAATRKRPTASLYNSTLVSKLWNSCATPILYRDLNIGEWDWRMKGTLLRTLDASLSLLPHIRSLSTSYPRLKYWNRSMLNASAVKEYDRRYPSYLESLESKEARDAAQHLNDDGEHIPELWKQSEHFARLKTIGAVEDVDASQWMDSKKHGDSSRRTGACALLALVNRAPSLTTLRLEKFDFGEVAGDDLEARLPLSLDHIVTLVLNTASAPFYHSQPNPLPYIISRIPNIESLDTGDLIPCLDAGIAIPKLRVLRLRHPLTAETFDDLEILVDEAAESLRSLHLTLKADLADRLPDLLSMPQTLKELSLKMWAPKENPLPEFFTCLASHSTLRSLFTTLDPFPALIEALPAGLVSLAVVHRSQNDAELAEGISALIASRRTRTLALALVRIGIVYRPKPFATLVEAARGIGLEIRLERADAL
ncbi:hypothetical protein RQP46_010296 [Phenoliferia psychrophenolica]